MQFETNIRLGDFKMEINARNKMKGKITDVKTGGVMASVKIHVDNPGEITALITKRISRKTWPKRR